MLATGHKVSLQEVKCPLCGDNMPRWRLRAHQADWCKARQVRGARACFAQHKCVVVPPPCSRCRLALPATPLHRSNARTLAAASSAKSRTSRSTSKRATRSTGSGRVTRATRRATATIGRALIPPRSSLPGDTRSLILILQGPRTTTKKTPNKLVRDVLILPSSLLH